MSGAYLGLAFVILILIIIVTIVLKCCFIIVPERRTVIIERLGKFHKQLSSGIHLKLPIFDRERKVMWVAVDYTNKDNVVERKEHIHKGSIDIRETVLDFEKEEVITSDRALIEIDAVIYYKISDPKLAVLRCSNLPYYLKLIAKAALRNIIAHLSLDDLISSREYINDELLDSLEENCLRIGVTITRVELEDIILESVIAQAMVEQLEAERERRSRILMAEGSRDSNIIMSAGSATRAVISSDAYRQTEIMKAESQARCKLSKAAADAECLEVLMNELKQSGSSVKAYEFMLKIRYLNELRTNPKFENIYIGPVAGFDEIKAMGKK